eukprot:TRINITY_DN7757_c0_g1_i1.p1 TRINITY_DN7757_c0_g1~~TRINITY_DN7757_c0_g1_i1.p1  ORF type:complete len:317 (+),score=40.63 TRINITY_DN7757_c0_g1_i1:400-1350(+)
MEDSESWRDRFYFIFTTGANDTVRLLDRLNFRGSKKFASGEWNNRHGRSLESVFFHHPDALVRIYSNTLPLDRFTELTSLGFDVAVQRYELRELLRGSPLEKWSANKDVRMWERSKHWYSHLTDVLRLFLVWKEGGTYLDTDVIIVRPLSDLHNVIGRVRDDRINGAVMRFEKGNRFLKDCMEELVKKFDPSEWAANGPDLITRVYEQNSYQKKEVSVLNNSMFYPLDGSPQGVGLQKKRHCYHKPLKMYMKEIYGNGTITEKRILEGVLEGAYTVHLNMKMTSGTHAHKNTLCLFLLNRFSVLRGRQCSSDTCNE